MVGRTPRLIALDWGSTSLRGYLMDAQGEVVAQRASEAGASKLDGGAEAFESALRGLAGDWLAADPELPVVACGMVGSKHGWAEAPYVSAPAPLSELAVHVRSVETPSGLRVRIVPGLSWQPADGAPEVMRGEETQVVALLAAQPELATGCRIVLPGTHSKWVLTRRSIVQSFQTYMTGELFDVLLRHSVLARTARPGDALDASAFERGVVAAQAHGGADLARLLFGVRTLGLFEHMNGQALADYTSGLLIGSEIVSATGSDPASDERPIRVVGADALVERYLLAFGLCGRAAEVAAVSAASGIWQIARQGSWMR
jgi:2-dehydro-3-deoxygalactonokinase